MKGRMGGSMGGYVERAPRCKHAWSKWGPAAVFDPRVRRTCTKCGRVQLRAANPEARQPSRRKPLTVTESAVVAAFAPDSEKVAALKTRLRASIKQARKAKPDPRT